MVRERFGGPACRIFRLLLMKRNLEQKQIAEMVFYHVYLRRNANFSIDFQAMISVKDTRELLYKLLKAKYVQIQEVARTSDHAPSRTFYLWRVDLPYVRRTSRWVGFIAKIVVLSYTKLIYRARDIPCNL